MKRTSSQEVHVVLFLLRHRTTNLKIAYVKKLNSMSGLLK